MKKRLLLGAVITAIAAVNSLAQIVPCPDCPPCTNCPPYTNNPIPPTEYPLDTMLMRVASVVNPTNGLVSTNYGWTVDTNNLLISAGGSGFDNSMSAGFSTLIYNIAITNTSPYRVYTLQFSPTVDSGYTNVTGPFIGTTNSSEYLASIVLPNSGNGFLRVIQQPGFISWAQAWTNGIVGGSGNGCPGSYHGYINWAFHIPQWGYYPITNLTDHTGTDLREPTNKLELATDYGWVQCATGTVDWTNSPTLNPPLYGTRARIAIFFKTYPTNQVYPLWLQGYYEPTNGFNPHSIIGGGGGLIVQPFEELDDIEATNWGITEFMTK